MDDRPVNGTRKYLFSNSLVISNFDSLTRPQIDVVIDEYLLSPVAFVEKYNTRDALKFVIDLGNGITVPALPIVSVCLMRYFASIFEDIGPGTFRGEASTVKAPLERQGFRVVNKEDANPEIMGRIRDAVIEVLQLQPHYRSTNSPEMEARGRSLDLIGVELRKYYSVNPVASSVQASNGAGNYAMVPWVRLFDVRMSPNARTGWYIVLLFAKDGQSVYLSLNQGTSELSKQEVTNRAAGAREGRLSSDIKALIEKDFTTEIELGPGGLADGYVAGNVIAKQYGVNDVPDDDVILQDVDALVPLLKKLYEDDEKVVSVTRSDEGGNLMSDPNLVALCADIYWNPADALELIGGLTDGSPQIILTGPPGTGKTWVASKIAKYILAQEGGTSYSDVDDSAVRLVQFHPSYGYEDFVEGLRPVPRGNGFEFVEHPGIIRQMAQAAENGSPQILIIDEVNRANIPRVFGELMYLLEYRDEKIHLQYGGEFRLPKNIFIIGTMNNADRSVRTIDLALRRRFDFFELAPNMKVLEAFYASRRNDLNENLWGGLRKLNQRIESELGVRHLSVGHSYFMKNDGMDRAQLEKIWKQQIFPLIEDYFYDQPELSKSFRLQDFWE